MEFGWLIVILLCIVFEISTVSLVSIWFIASGIVALIVSYFTDSFAIQMAVFVLLGTFLLLTTRKPLQKMAEKVNKEKTNVDRILDMTGKVTEKIEKNKAGAVKVDGKVWTAISDDEIAVDSIVKVLSIESTKIKVEKVED